MCLKGMKKVSSIPVIEKHCNVRTRIECESRRPKMLAVKSPSALILGN